MPAIFDDILEVLSDGEYHAFEEIKFKVTRNLNETQVKAVLAFLDSYCFVKRRRQKAKLDLSFLKFLKRIRELEDVEDEEEREARSGVAYEAET